MDSFYFANLLQSLLEMQRRPDVLDRTKRESRIPWVRLQVQPVWVWLDPEDFSRIARHEVPIPAPLLEFLHYQGDERDFWRDWKKWKEICCVNQDLPLPRYDAACLILPAEPD